MILHFKILQMLVKFFLSVGVMMTDHLVLGKDLEILEFMAKLTCRDIWHHTIHRVASSIFSTCHLWA